jgi:hypothetical protein
MILGMGIPRLHATWFATKVAGGRCPHQPDTTSNKREKDKPQNDARSDLQGYEGWDTYGKKMLLATQI